MVVDSSDKNIYSLIIIIYKSSKFPYMRWLHIVIGVYRYKKKTEVDNSAIYRLITKVKSNIYIYIYFYVHT